MHDFGRILREGLAAVLILLCDQREHLFELGEGGLPSVHQRVAASESRDLGHPRAIVLSVEYDLVVIEAHGGDYTTGAPVAALARR